MSFFAVNAFAGVSSIVVDADTGLVVQVNNADEKRQPASLTKMMTIYMLFEAIEKGWITPDQELPVSARASRQPPAKLGLRKGDTITVKEAILAMITKSANDVATVVAEAIGGSEEQFAKMTTKMARELGMKDTVFRNSSGLYHSKQLTTARDMAILGMALQRHFPQYYHVFSTDKFEFNDRTYRTHNGLLKKYNGADGIKTGYIAASGYNLVSSARRGNKRLVAVVMGSWSAKSRDRLMTALLDNGFMKLMVAEGRLPMPDKKPDEDNLATASADFSESDWSVGEEADEEIFSSDESFGAGDKFDWAIQVGAFSNYLVAKKTAASARDFLEPIIGKYQVQVLPFDFGADMGVVYKSRLLGMREKQAINACSSLRKNEMPCLVLPPENLKVGGNAKKDGSSKTVN